MYVVSKKSSTPYVRNHYIQTVIHHAFFLLSNVDSDNQRYKRLITDRHLCENYQWMTLFNDGVWAENNFMNVNKCSMQFHEGLFFFDSQMEEPFLISI